PKTCQMGGGLMASNAIACGRRPDRFCSSFLVVSYLRFAPKAWFKDTLQFVVGVWGRLRRPQTPTIGEVWRGPGTLWGPPPNLPNCQVDRVRIEPCLTTRVPMKTTESPPPQTASDVQPRARPARPSVQQTFAALRHRNYRLWFSGQLVSLFGTWMQTTA